MTVDPLIGQILDGRYRVLSHLGEGGMGAVYKAEHIAMAQPVAIKVLLTESESDPSMVKRFIQEARSCFRIDHPNCVRVTDFGAAENGSLYFAMEYLDGRTMGTDLHVDGPMSGDRVRHIASQAALALHHAHGHGIIHRDLKPANIMLVQRDADPDFVKVFDFGLGKLVDEGAMLTGLTMSPLTQAGIVFGTPEYMSPEQARGDTLMPASDIYTLAVCCYEMMTGELPFEGKTFTEILSKHVTQTPVPPSLRFPDMAFDAQLEALVLRCLSKDPTERPGSQELAAELTSTSGNAAPSTVSSETLIVSEESMASLAEVGYESGSDARSPRDSTFSLRGSGWVLGLGLAAIAAVVVAYLGLRGTGSNSVNPESAASQMDATVAPVVAIHTVDAGSLPAETPMDASVNPADTGAKKSAKKPIPDKHLEAAEAAYQSGNVLKQLSEANASLKRNRKGRRAAFLVGDALEKSGDKVAACKFFRRAGKKHYRAAGCN